MNHQELIDKTVEHIAQQFTGEEASHDWWHIRRVWQNALAIGQKEGADLLIVQLGALLHDIADWKFHKGDEEAGPRVATEWLQSIQAPQDLISKVTQIIREVTFKGAGVETKPCTLEAQVVQDADRLDAIGAIGIGRAFAYGGHKGRELYNPSIAPELHASFEEYKKNQAPTLNHFYEKLFLLKDRLNTQTAKSLADKRHAFMETFVQQFLEEWHSGEPAPQAFNL